MHRPLRTTGPVLEDYNELIKEPAMPGALRIAEAVVKDGSVSELAEYDEFNLQQLEELLAQDVSFSEEPALSGATGITERVSELAEDDGFNLQQLDEFLAQGEVPFPEDFFEAIDEVAATGLFWNAEADINTAWATEVETTQRVSEMAEDSGSVLQTPTAMENDLTLMPLLPADSAVLEDSNEFIEAAEMARLSIDEAENGAVLVAEAVEAERISKMAEDNISAAASRRGSLAVSAARKG